MARRVLHLVALIALAVLVALAGCAGPAGPADRSEPPAPAPHAAGPAVLHLHGTTTAGLYARNDPGGPFSRLDYNVTRNTTAILVEVRWNDTLQDLDARTWPNDVDACPPPSDPADPFSVGDAAVCTLDDASGYGPYSNRGGDAGAGDSPSRLLVNQTDIATVQAQCGRDPCAWQAFAWARTPVADLEWDLWVSVFEGPVPDGYTAIPRAG